MGLLDEVSLKEGSMDIFSLEGGSEGVPLAVNKSVGSLAVDSCATSVGASAEALSICCLAGTSAAARDGAVSILVWSVRPFARLGWRGSERSSCPLQ